MAQGMSNSAACREVGVNRKTGNRWRYGRRVVDRAGREHVYPPIIEQRDDGTVSARFLSEDEHIAIADLLPAGNSLRAIARNSAAAPPPSAERYAATATRAPASTTPSTPSDAPSCDVRARRTARYAATRS
jgi:hypothetical protein